MTSLEVLILVVFIRALAPFTILRWPLAGVFLSILGDISDVMLFEKFGTYVGDSFYHNFDKFFDIYYLFFAFLAASRWKDPLARKTAQVLFIWRFVGFTIFELTNFRPAFFMAPNIFENFFVVYLILKQFKPQFTFSAKTLMVFLAIVGIPKIIQEYIMHFAYPDQTWNFMRDHLFWWLYDR